MDVLGRSTGRFEPGTSCPGVISHKPGGVARNVASLLARAGAPVRFSSVVGDDETGRALIEALRQARIETSDILALRGRRTGSYLAIHDERGELVAAVSDLSIYDDYALPADLWTGHSGLAFADANIPGACIRDLADRFGASLCVDAISRAKAPKLRAILGSEALLVANLPSVCALLDETLPTARQAAEKLAAAGATRAVISAGSAPLAVLDQGEITEFHPRAVTVVDVTGTGDAQIAGLLLARLAGHGLTHAVTLGMQAARAALGCAGALERLPSDLITEAGWPSPS